MWMGIADSLTEKFNRKLRELRVEEISICGKFKNCRIFDSKSIETSLFSDEIELNLKTVENKSFSGICSGFHFYFNAVNLQYYLCYDAFLHPNRSCMLQALEWQHSAIVKILASRENIKLLGMLLFFVLFVFLELYGGMGAHTIFWGSLDGSFFFLS